MSLIWGLVALLVAAIAATCGVRAARRALAGGLIGEISETLTLLETPRPRSRARPLRRRRPGAEPSGAADAQLSRRRRVDGVARRSSGAVVGELLRLGPGAARRIARLVERDRGGRAERARQIRVAGIAANVHARRRNAAFAARRRFPSPLRVRFRGPDRQAPSRQRFSGGAAVLTRIAPSAPSRPRFARSTLAPAAAEG